MGFRDAQQQLFAKLRADKKFQHLSDAKLLQVLQKNVPSASHNLQPSK